MPDDTELQGGCLCGAVRIAVTPDNRSVGACHCDMCRKWGGGPLLAIEYGGEPRFEGEDAIAVYDSSDWAERGFCRHCGSHLFYRLKAGGFYGIPVGLFDSEERWVFDHQVFIDEKPPYYAFGNETKNLTGAEAFALFSAPSE